MYVPHSGKILNKKPVKLFLYIVFFIQALSCSTCLYAQQPGSSSIEQVFLNYQQQQLHEKIYLHTDKDFYLAGETIWFKAYIMDAFFHRPLPVSIIAYVEVIDRNKKPVMQTAIDISNNSATGCGSFTIPSYMNSEKYTLRAYTNWMKNRSDVFFFSKSISIVNTIAGSIPKMPVRQPDSISIELYPEGGNLVYGLSSRLAFKMLYTTGEAVTGSGIITANRKDTVADFITDENGTGSFYIIPQKGASYQFVLANSTIPCRVHWPAVYEEGYVLNLKEEAGKIKLRVQSNVKNAGVVYLLVHTRQVLKQFQKAAIDASGTAVFLVNLADAGDGISHLIVFNENQLPVCERLFFKPPASYATAAVKTDKDSYGVRERVTAAVTVKNESGEPLKANLSASIFLVDSLQPEPEEDITTYLLLTSELGNRLENPLQYFNKQQQSVKEKADHIMLVNGWSRFRWEDVLKNNQRCFTYLPEKEGQVIKARISNSTSGLPLKNTAAFLTVPGERFTLANAVSDDTGVLNFIFKPARQRNELILQAASSADSNAVVEVDPYYFPVHSIPPAGLLRISRQNESKLLQRSIYMQVENSYNIDKRHLLVEKEEMDTAVFYGFAARQYRLDDYTRFLTMEEVIKEYIAELAFKKAGDHYQLRVKDKAIGTFFENAPLVLMDGVPLKNADKVMSFDPLKIRTVDITASRYFHNTQVYEGIVSFKTYDGNLAGYELDPDNIVVEYNALQLQQEFYKPVYNNDEKKKSRLPDFRNMLSWEPRIDLDADGTATFDFYTSGCTGRFLIFLQGLSPNGLPVAASRQIEVSP